MIKYDQKIWQRDKASNLLPTKTTLVRSRTLVMIRWIAVIGQLVSLLTVYYALDFDFPILYCLLTVGLSATLNIFIFFRGGQNPNLSENEAGFYLSFDIIQLGLLIGLTGGLQNPFAILFLVPVMISATNLPIRSTIILSLLVILSVSMLSIFHRPLPWGNEILLLSNLYLVAIWVALVISTVVIAAYAARISVEGSNMAKALQASQMALAREQRLSAIGALAAAAAHQLGTPLGTIAVASKELVRDLPIESHANKDAQLIRDEVVRCREILNQLSVSETEEDTIYSRIQATDLIEAAASPHLRQGKNFIIHDKTADNKLKLLIPRRAEIMHSLGNILENALYFAKTSVTAEIEWQEKKLIIEILDDGPGFSPNVLMRLGEPYISTRGQDNGHGLGLFIAKNLIERTGGDIDFKNNPLVGAKVRVLWPVNVIESLTATSV
tara:strand:- start:47386 stop:48705 length:1320 start_codon:yes stop_codon:yes gene_type:complete